jgi:hypothetical protein
MKKRSFLILIMTPLMMASCSLVQPKSGNQIKPCSLVTKADAEKTLGQPLLAPYEKTTTEDGVINSSCDYSKVGGPAEGGLTVYVLQSQQTPSVDWAKSVMAARRKQFAADRVESLTGFGDDAFYRITRLESDKYDIWVRTNDKVFALSLLGSPGKSSLDEHKLLAKKIAGEL